MSVRTSAILAGAAALLMTVPTARADDQLVQGGRSAGFSGFSDWDSRGGPDRFRRADENLSRDLDRRPVDPRRDDRGRDDRRFDDRGFGPGGASQSFYAGPGGPGGRFAGPPQHQDFRRDGGRSFMTDWRGQRGPTSWRSGGNFDRRGPAFGRSNFGRGGNSGWMAGRGMGGRGFSDWRGGRQGRGGQMAHRFGPGRGGFGQFAGGRGQRGGQRAGMNRGGWRGGFAAAGRGGRGRGGCGRGQASRGRSDWRRGFGQTGRSGRGRPGGFGPSNRFGFNFGRGWADRGRGFGDGYRGEPRRPAPAPAGRSAPPSRPSAPAAPARGSDLERRLESLMRDVEDLRRALRR